METNPHVGDGSSPDRWKEPAPVLLLTHEQLQKIAPVKQTAIDLFLPWLNKGLAKYQVNTPQRMSAFLAQILHESGYLRYVKEIWGPTHQQKKYERDFSHPYGPGLKPDKRNYLSYMLGNSEIGDGKYFMGRGLIQITGRTNYKKCSFGLFGDETKLLKQPQLLEVPEYAVASAFWYCFDYRKLGDEFDSAGINDETRGVNGGLNGIADRQKLYDKAILVLA